MPYYVYLKSDGKAISPKHTISPQDMENISDTFFQVSEPMSNPIFDNGEFREMTAEEITAANAQAEIARQEAKPLALKQSENEYLALLASLAVTVTLEPGDNSDTITQKLEASGMTEVEALKIGVKLLNAIHEVEIKGGSWYDLPTQPHSLEG